MSCCWVNCLSCWSSCCSSSPDPSWQTSAQIQRLAAICSPPECWLLLPTFFEPTKIGFVFVDLFWALLIRGSASLGLCTWLAFAWISSLWDSALLISSERTGLLFPSCWIHSHLSSLCSLLYFRSFHSLMWKWFHFSSLALWIQFEDALNDFQYYLNYLFMLCCLVCDKQACGLRAILLPQFWLKFLSIK